MGVFGRIGDLADRIYSASDLTGVAARFNRRRDASVETLIASGSPAQAVVTGLRRAARSDGDGASDIVTLRLEWSTEVGDRVGAAVVSGQGEGSPALRLGVRIPVRYDDRHVVPVHRLPPGTAIAVTDRIPAVGIEDARGHRGRLPAGDEQQALVASIARRTLPLLGLPADSWDITLRLADGSDVLAADGAAPSYVHHALAPGARVPVVVAHARPERVRIDWVRLARECAAAAGHVDDPPPSGSIAAALAAAAGSPAPTVGVGADSATAARSDAAASPDASSGVEAAGNVEGVSLEVYAAVHAALRTARVPPEGYDEFAARRFGTPLGRWAAVDAGWQRRIMADWRVGAAFAEAVEAAARRR